MFYLVAEQGLPFNPSLLKGSPGPPLIHGLQLKTGLYFLGWSELFVLFLLVYSEIILEQIFLRKRPV